MDFTKYSTKLEKEQKDRAERGRRDKERLAREKARQDQKKAELEESRRIERLKKEAEEEQAELRIEADRESNGGFYLSVRLQPVPFDPSEKGIFRGKDKIALPPSVRESLREQGAERQYSSPMFFELRTLISSSSVEKDAAASSSDNAPAVLSSSSGEERYCMLHTDFFSKNNSALERNDLLRKRKSSAALLLSLPTLLLGSICWYSILV
jgi:hypothetical protein